MRKRALAISLFSFIIGTALVSAATKTTFDTAVWIPYWRKDDGATSTLANLNKVTQISPFAYELQPDGSLKDALKGKEEPWTTLISQAKKKGVKIYPTILSYPQTSTEQYDVYLLMAQRKKRYKLESDIVTLVKTNKYDGIDIDLENKPAEIKPYFSAFLNELGVSLRKGGKKLICTVEARTPPESKYGTTSPDILAHVEYANDYKAIGKACDQVRIMAYDQGADDVNLLRQNKANGNIYKPVADIDWVEKITTLALEDIPAKKIILGVPTYGYKYEVIPAVGTTSAQYPRVGSMNFNYVAALVQQLGITPTRNSAGELSFTYATTTGVNGESLGGWHQYLVWYSDAQAIADKIRLAKLYKLGGIAIFKLDGGQDPNLWSILSAK